jgi:hypothetical protein
MLIVSVDADAECHTRFRMRWDRTSLCRVKTGRPQAVCAQPEHRLPEQGRRTQLRSVGLKPDLLHSCEPVFVDNFVLHEPLGMNVAQALVALRSGFGLQLGRENVPGRQPSADGTSEYWSAHRADVSFHDVVNRHMGRGKKGP